MVSRLEELKSKSTGLYKLIVIIGKSRSGKDTLARYLNELHHVEPIVSYATRPKRDNEKNGREHWFVSPEYMNELKQNSDMIAYTYNAKTGHEYCASLKDLKPDTWYTYILNPKGLYYLVSNMSDKVFLHVVYVDCDENDLRKRGKDRGELPEVFETRIESERDEFDYFSENYKYLINGRINTSVVSFNEMIAAANNIIEKANNHFDNYRDTFVKECKMVTGFDVSDNVYVDGVNHFDYFTPCKIVKVIDDGKKFLEPYYVLDKFPDTIVRDRQIRTNLTENDKWRLLYHMVRNWWRKVTGKEYY